MRKNDQVRSKKLAARVRARQKRMKNAEVQLAQNILRVERELGQGRHVRRAQAKRPADRLKVPQDIQRRLGLVERFSGLPPHLMPQQIAMPSEGHLAHLEYLVDALVQSRPVAVPTYPRTR